MICRRYKSLTGLKDVKGLLKATFGSPIVLVFNSLLAHAIFFMARLAYFFVDYSYFVGDLSASSLWVWVKGSLLFDTTVTLYTYVLYTMMMLLPLWREENQAYHRLYKWIFMVINALSLAINLADSVYFPLTLYRTATTVFYEFDNENNIAGILLHNAITHWYLFLIFILIPWLANKLYVMPHTDYRSYQSLRQRLIYAAQLFICFAVATILTVAGYRGGLQPSMRPITISNVNRYVERPTDCALVLNAPFALIRTMGRSDFPAPDYFPSLAATREVYDPVYWMQYREPNSASDVRLPDKEDIVILIVESFGRGCMEASNRDFFDGEYKECTPNVDKLVDKNLVYYFSYCNGRKSIDGIPSILCSTPRFGGPFILAPVSMNSYTGTPELFSKWDYQMAFFHGANCGFMEFLAFTNRIEFQHYYGRQDYDEDPRFDGNKGFDGNWSIWDEPFLQYYCAKMGEMKQPFMTALFTVPSHDLFVVPGEYKNIYKEEHLPIQRCIRYTDMAIGKFSESASKQPWFRNTIFVLTGGHTNQGDHEQYRTDIGGFCSPIIIYDPSGKVEPGRVDGVTQQIDIMPTLLFHIGHSVASYLAFGKGLLHIPAKETWAINYLNGIYRYAKYGYVPQWNGKQTKTIYRVTDALIRHNLLGHMPEQTEMEQELKAIIYQYMYRMIHGEMHSTINNPEDQ